MEDNKNTTEAELFDLGTNSMMLYGINIIMLRAIPHLVDGLKPIHRRILYSLWKKYDKDEFVKVASAMGDVLHYSPHGDQGLCGTYARMAQTFSNNAPYLTPDGNAGTPTAGSDYAAERYWDVKLSNFSYDVFFKEFDGKVNMVPNYDNKDVEPLYLPARFPTVLLNGTDGIAYTMLSDIPPYNLNEVADATLKLLENPDAKIKLVPDSPTYCDVIIRDDETFIFQSTFDIDNRNYTITINHTPYAKYLRKIQKDIWAMQDNPETNIPEILTADDESDGINGKDTELVIRCKPCNLYTVINKLFRRIPALRNTMSTKNVLVIDPAYKTCKFSPRQVLLAWIQVRLNDKRNWYLRDLVAKTQKYNMLDGKAFMLNDKNLDKTIAIFRKCPTPEDIVNELVKAYKGKITTSQANYISDAKLRHLTQSEFRKTIEEMKKLDDAITEIKAIISDPKMIKAKIVEDIKEIKAKYGVPRKSKILNVGNYDRSNVGVVQLLTDGSVIFGETENPDHLSSDVTPVSSDKVCLIDNKAQFVWVDTSKAPHDKPVTLTSVGKTVMGLCVAAVSNLSNNILLLSNLGRVKYMPINKIPSNASRKPLIQLNPDETIVSILELRDESEDILIYTKDGMGKRIQTSSLNKVSSIDSLGQFLIKDVDNVSGMFCINNKNPLLVYVTLLGRMRVNNAKFLTSGKKFGDMKPIIKLSSQDDLIAVFCVDKNQSITLNHADGRVSVVNIGSLPVSTMAIPPERPKHVPATRLIRAIVNK